MTLSSKPLASELGIDSNARCKLSATFNNIRFPLLKSFFDSGLTLVETNSKDKDFMTYNEDWLALFNARSIGAGTYNERLLAYINNKLGSSHTDLNKALQALAVDQGDANYSSMGTFTP